MFTSTFRKMKPKILRNPVSLVIFLLVILVILVILTNLMILTNLNLVMKLKNLLILAIPIYLWILVIVLNSMNMAILITLIIDSFCHSVITIHHYLKTPAIVPDGVT